MNAAESTNAANATGAADSNVAAPASERNTVAEVLATVGEGTQLLESAYRELWAARERERSERSLLAAECVRELCHELRNPLGGVRGLTALLERELDRTDATPRARRLAAKLAGGLAAMESILEGNDVEFERVDAATIADETIGLTLAEDRAEGGNTRFRVEAASGIELPVSANDFRKILGNLVRNAAQACRGRGTVTVFVRSSMRDVVLFVEDDGVGLPSVSDDDLFRHGFSTKGPRRGHGLSVTAEIVREAGGTLHYCRLDRGTLARVRFPRG
jgi:signal transduction histidine kinase